MLLQIIRLKKSGVAKKEKNKVKKKRETRKTERNIFTDKFLLRLLFGSFVGFNYTCCFSKIAEITTI